MATKKLTPAAPEVPTVRVRAIDPIRADGADYAPGELIDLAQADADALVAGGWAELAPTTLPSLGDPLGPEVALV